MKLKTTTLRVRLALVVTIALGAIVSVSAAPARATWSEPTAPPPGGNVKAPLNTSSIGQTKVGALTVQGVFTASGGIQASVTTGDFGVQSTAPNAAAGVTTAGIVGRGQSAVATGSSVGVYGISFGSPGNGSHIGLLGVANADTTNSYGVYGWNRGLSNAYAGYFLGKTEVVGDLTATRYCLGGTCIDSWSDVGGAGGGESLFTESPEDNTYLADTGSNVSLGGTSSANAAFFFDVSANSGNGQFYTPGGIVLGEPIGGQANNGICQQGEQCSPSNQDCWDQPANCSGGQICSAGSCVASDQSPPQVTVNSPTPGQVVTGTITITASATDAPPGTVSAVLFYRDDSVVIGQDSSSPYTLDWNTNAVLNGGHTIQAVAEDSGGNATTSTSVSVTVNNSGGSGDTTPPFTITNLAELPNSDYATRAYLWWDAGLDQTPDSGITSYHLWRKQGSGIPCATVEASPDYQTNNPSDFTIQQSGGSPTGKITFVNVSLSANTAYTYCVKAINGATPPLESPSSAAVTITTIAQDPGGSGDDGSSPVILKIPCCSTPAGARAPLSLPIAAVEKDITKPVASAMQSGFRPLSQLLTIPTAQAKIPGFSIPVAQAAAPFGGNSNIRLTINDGVLQINDNNGTVMELGNGATDLTSTGDINLRPRATATNGEVRIGSQANPGKICLYGSGSADCQSSWPTGGGGGVVTNVGQVIWNTVYSGPGGPLGTGIQPNASFNISNSGTIGNTLTVGTTLTVGANTLVTTATNVGIGTASPAAAYKLDVNGSLQVQTGSIHFTSASLQNCDTIDTSNGTIICGSDSGGAGGTVGTDGNGGNGRVAFWTNASTISGSGQLVWDNTLTRLNMGSLTLDNSYATSGLNLSPSDVFLASGGTSPNAGQIIFGDNTGWRFNFGSEISGNFVSKITFDDRGRIGINDSAPSLPLSVVGNAKISDGSDLVVGGTGIGDGDSVTEICFEDACLNDWSNLILNTGTGSPYAGQSQTSASFNIGGTGRVVGAFTVETGPLQLPSTNRVTLGNEIRQGAAYNGYTLSSQIRFGGNNSPVQGLGILEDDSDNVIAVITEDRKLHLGYDAGTSAGATQLCFYGQANGDAQCVSQLSDFGGGGAVSNAGQVIWNTVYSGPGGPLGTGIQPNASFNISNSGTIGNTLTVGGNVGIGSSVPLHALSLGAGKQIGLEATPPTISAVIFAPIGGTSLPIGSHFFKVTAVDALGNETNISGESPTACVTADSNDRCSVNVSAVTGAVTYRAYRRTLPSATYNGEYRDSATQGINYVGDTGTRTLPAGSTFSTILLDNTTSYFLGNVGFGTTSPQARLHAVNARLEGDTFVPVGGNIQVGDVPVGNTEFSTRPLAINTGGDADNAITLLSGNVDDLVSLGLGGTGARFTLGYAGGIDNWSSLTEPKDIVFRIRDNDLLFVAGNTTSTSDIRFGTGSDLLQTERLTIFNGGNVKVQGTSDFLIGGAGVDGTVAGQPELCLNGTCVTSLSSGGVVTNVGQVIWNTVYSGPGGPLGTGIQPNASFNISNSGTIGNNLTVNGAVAIALVGSPAIDLAIGDTDSGINWENDGDYYLVADNSNILKISSANSGSVGIGTTTPGAELTIFGDQGESSTIIEQLLQLGVSGGQVGSIYRDNNGAGNYLGIESFNVGNTVKRPLVLQEFGGAVGIGTASPLGIFHVRGRDDAVEAIILNRGLDTGAPGIPDIGVAIGNDSVQGRLTVNNNLGGATFNGDPQNAISTYASTSGSAIYAQQQNASGYAGYFSGRVNVAGDLNVTGNSTFSGGLTIESGIRVAKYLYAQRDNVPDESTVTISIASLGCRSIPNIMIYHNTYVDANDWRNDGYTGETSGTVAGYWVEDPTLTSFDLHNDYSFGSGGNTQLDFRYTVVCP